MLKTVDAAAPQSRARNALSHYRAGTALALCMVCAMSLTAKPALAGGALPTGGQYVAGQGTISGPGNTLTVNQSSSRGIINWQGFSIGNGNTVQFDNGSGATLNRVTGGNLSQIDGSLKATGSVYLINPQGIVIGPSGTVVTNGSFVASTRDVANSAFMGGGAFAASGSSNGSVVNQGVITSNTGDAILVGSSVTNSGTISAPNGTVGLAAGNEILLQPVGSDSRIAISGGTGSVTNTGTLNAAQAELNSAGGNVYALVENNGGSISATGTRTIGGHVWLTAGGTTTITGAISATNANGTGGAVSVNGAIVSLQGATIRADGLRAGGTITIGTSGTQSIGADSATVLDASAMSAGSGGSITVKSLNTTFAGTANAKGGASSGAGGNVETSGGILNIAGAHVDTTASHGATGNWLLDPTNINIVSGGTDPIGGSNIDPGTIAAALNTSNVTLEATNDITITNALNYTSSNTLNLLAEADIFANAGIQNMGSGAINLIAGWNGVTLPPSPLTAPGVFGNNDGSIFIGGASAPGNVSVGSAGGVTTLAAASIAVSAVNGYAQVGYHGAGGGNVIVDTTGPVIVVSSNAIAEIGNNNAGAGNVSGNITVASAGDIDVEATGPGTFAAIGNITTDASSSASGTITINTGGTLNLQASAQIGSAAVGNFSTVATTGGATGDITVNAGNVQFEVFDAGEYATIGDGGRFTNSGPTGGTINITTGTLTMNAFTNASDDATGQVRIANRGDGVVAGDIDIAATGNVALNAGDSGLASIGNGEAGSGTTSGAINVNVGGMLSLNATGSGEARIAAGYAPDTNITVVAAGDIVLGTAADSDGTTTGGQAFIGNFFSDAGSSGGNISVTSTGGRVFLIAGEDQSNVQIGNSTGLPTTGAVTVSASNGIQIMANGSSSVAEIGNSADMGDATGAVSVTSGGDIDLDAFGQSAVATIGNIGTGSASNESGDIGVTATGNIFVNALGFGGLSYIGNLSTVTSIGGATGDISVSANNLVLNAQDAGEEAIIGDGGKFTNSGVTGGLITVNVNSLTLQAPTASDDDAAGQARIANRGTGTVQGDIDITSASSIVLAAGDEGLASIGNGQGGGGTTTGNIAMNAGSSLTVYATGGGNARIGTGDGTGSINVTAAGDILLETASDADGTTMGGSAFIGNFQAISGPAGGVLNVTSTGGTVSLFAFEDQSTAEIGSPFGTPSASTITVSSAGNVQLSAAGAGAFALIGNSNGGNTGDVGGNISVTSGGDIDLQASNQSAFAQIGNITTDTTSSASGEIAVTAAGTLSVTSGVQLATAGVGNLGTIATTGGATGDITINAANVQLEVFDAGEYATIGDGGRFTNSGLTGGTITIDAGTLTLYAPTSTTETAAGQARIANRGDGVVQGDINITTTGDINIIAGDGGVSGIGNGQGGTGTDGGNITVQSGGNIFLAATGAGEARISSGLAPDSNINVTAAGQIDLATNPDPDGTTTGALTFIGSFLNDSGGGVSGNVSVTSTGAGVSLTANEDQSTVEIGNQSGAPSGGGVAVTGFGLINVVANGTSAIAEIGNSADAGDATGYIAINAGQVSVIANGQSSFAAIGNMGTGATGSQSGSISVTVDGSLNIDAQNLGGLAYVGNFSTVVTTGGATGEIIISAGSITLDANDASEQAIIGDGGRFTNSGPTGGLISINTGSLTLQAFTASDDNAAGQVRIANRGDGAVSGDINIIATGDINLTAGDEGLASIGNGEGGTGAIAGNIFIENGGNIFLTATGAGNARIATSLGAASNITVLSAGQIGLAADPDADGTTTGGLAFIGDFQNEAGGEAGTITVQSHGAGISLTANEDQSTVEIGNSTGAPSGGNVSVSSLGLVDVVANGTGAVAEIGNNADQGDATGNISVSGSEISVITNGQSSFAVIGNLTSGATSSASGDITINASSLNVDAQAFGSLAYIGNLSSVVTSGGATGDITITGGAVELYAAGGGDQAIVGDGGRFTNEGPTGGTITINADSLTLQTPSNETAIAQARIANRGTGQVSGDIDITTTGGVDLDAGDNGLAGIGNGQAGTGPTSGNITVTSGSFLQLTATGTGNARIATGASTDSVINVAAAGDITLATAADLDGTATGGSVFIGNLSGVTTSNVGGNVSVISTGGSIFLAPGEDQSYAQIGNQGGAPSSGTVTVTANAGNITLGVAGADALAQIGNGGMGMPGDATGNIVVSAGGLLGLGVIGAGSVAQIGNGDAFGAGTGNASGDITIRVAGETELLAGAWIGNIADPGFVESGNVTLITGTQDPGNPVVLAPSLIADLGSTAVPGSGGNVTVGFTSEDMPVDSAVSYDSPNALSLLSTGNIFVNASIQNAGSGAINLVAGWDGMTLPPASLTAPGVYGNGGGSITVGGTGGSGNVSLGSASGTTTLAGSNVTVEADNGRAQVGYHGAGGGAIDVDATNNVTVTTNNFNAFIGNGGGGVSGNTGGAITVDAGGNVTVNNQESASDLGILFAAIGNISGDSVSSQSGDIAITAGGTVTVEGHQGFGLAYIGNFSALSTTGGATGDITINASAVDVLSLSGSFESIIGDGGLDLNTGVVSNGGPTGGNITINAGSVTVQAKTNGDQARIANRGSGTVTGNIDIATTGDIDVLAGDNTLADIGNGGIGTTAGDITINAGGNINLSATGSGNARIAGTFAADTDISVTAAGNITLSTAPDSDGSTTGASVFIGNFAIDEAPVGGNITITSTGGSISLNAAENQSTTMIGNLESTAASGNVAVSANNITLSAGGAGALAQIGNGGAGMAGDATGDITLAATGNLSLGAAGAGAFAQIGNGDATGTGTGNASGDITITVVGTTTITASPTSGTAWIGNIAEPGYIESGDVALTTGAIKNTGVFGGTDTLAAMIAADLGTTAAPGSGGDFSLTLTNPAKHTLSGNLGASTISYSSPNTLSIAFAGALTDDVSLLNGGGGEIALLTVGSGNLVLNAAVEAGTVDFVSAGAISGNGAGYITATALEGSSQGATTLTAANAIADLGPFTVASGHFTLDDTTALTITGPVNVGGAVTLTTAGSGNGIAIDAALAGTTVDLVSAGTITESNSGDITATTLEGSSNGDAMLGLNGNILVAINNVGTLGAFTTNNGMLGLSDGPSLKITGPVNVGTGQILILDIGSPSTGLTVAGTMTGYIVSLVSLGTINETAAGGIVATGFGGETFGGNVTLNSANNNITYLGSFVTANGNFALTDAASLTVVDGSPTVNTGTGNLSLTTTGTGNNLTIDGGLTGGTVSLVSGGAISQNADGIITATTLKGSSGGTTLLAYGNSIANLGPFASGSTFNLNDIQALTVTAAVSAGGTGGVVALQTAGGLEINGSLTGFLVDLNASGEIGSSGAGVITANSLEGSSNGAVQLTAKNQVVDLENFTTNGGAFSFSDNTALTVAGVLNTGSGDIALTTTGTANDMTITGTVQTTGTLTLVTSGAANETNTGAILVNTLNVTAQTGISLTSPLNMINHVGKDKTKSGPNNITL